MYTAIEKPVIIYRAIVLEGRATLTYTVNLSNDQSLVWVCFTGAMRIRKYINQNLRVFKGLFQLICHK